MKVFILTLGCKVNQYESEAILEMFKKSGFKKTDNFKNADVLIINSFKILLKILFILRNTLFQIFMRECRKEIQRQPQNILN